MQQQQSVQPEAADDDVMRASKVVATVEALLMDEITKRENPTRTNGKTCNDGDVDSSGEKGRRALHLEHDGEQRGTSTHQLTSSLRQGYEECLDAKIREKALARSNDEVAPNNHSRPPPTVRAGAYTTGPGLPLERTTTLRYSVVGRSPVSDLSSLSSSTTTGGEIMQRQRPSLQRQQQEQLPSPANDSPAANTVIEEEDLVTARPVDEEDIELGLALPRARESQPVLKKSRDDKKKSQVDPRSFFLGFALAAVLMGLVMGLYIAITDGNSNNNASPFPTSFSPTTAPTSMSLQDKIVSLLPDNTVDAIMSNTNSSQAAALDWMIEDPWLDTYSEDRIRQRFALATLYFSTGGNSWANNTNWLSYEVHECSWFCNVQTETRMEGRTYDYLPWIWPDMSQPICNSDGQYERLWLSRNDLAGTLPPELFLLTNLVDLNLFWNQDLIGTIPSQTMSQLSKLTGLDLSGSGLTGTIPTQTGLLTNLRGFSVQVSRELAGTIPTELGFLIDMRILKVDATSLSGTIPSQIGLLTKLNSLYLGSESLSSTIPEEVIELQDMHEFHLSRCNISGTIPSEIGLWSNLLELFVFDTSLTGSIPSEIGGLTNLERITMGMNLLTSTIPSSIGLLENLMVFGLAEMPLTGTIPTEVGLLPFLGNTSNTSLSYTMRNYYGYPSYFAVADTSLTGTIPSELSGMSYLEGLWLYGNELTGTIPAEFGKQKQLIELRLQNNGLSGPIPSKLGLMSGMSWFELQNNSLTGELPSELGIWSDIWMFDVANNELEGLIPSEILDTFGTGNSSSLELFSIVGNTLSGTLPPNICKLDSVLDNGKDDGLFFDCSGSLCGCNCSCVRRS